MKHKPSLVSLLDATIFFTACSGSTSESGNNDAPNMSKYQQIETMVTQE